MGCHNIVNLSWDTAVRKFAQLRIYLKYLCPAFPHPIGGVQGGLQENNKS